MESIETSAALDKPLPRDVARAMMVREFPGRPCKLTPELAEQVVESVANGAFLSAAAGRVGVHRDTVRDWITRGQADAQVGRTTEFSTFAEAIARAQSDHEAKLAAAFTRGGDGKYPDWRAQAFLVERRYEHWRLPKETASVGLTLQLSNEQLAALTDALRIGAATDVTPAGGILPTSATEREAVQSDDDTTHNR